MFANSRGFISIYALMLLSVILAFSTMFAQRINTYAKIAKTKDQANLVDLFIVHEIKQYLTELNDQKQDSEQDVDDIQIDDHDTSKDFNEKKDEEMNGWEATYNSCNINFDEQDDGIQVQYLCDAQSYNVFVRIDENKTQIMNYEYVIGNGKE